MLRWLMVCVYVCFCVCMTQKVDDEMIDREAGQAQCVILLT